MIEDVEIIAEVKTMSPFGFRSDKNWEELFSIADRIGDMISIHTDPRWGGSFGLLKKACSLTEKPILAKGIHQADSDVEAALESGADYVLVVGRLPSANMKKCIIEPLSLEELKNIPEGMKVVWNSRDITTGAPKKETFQEARASWSGWLCQASFIRSPADIKQGADAVLVGTHLPEFAESLE